MKLVNNNSLTSTKTIHYENNNFLTLTFRIGIDYLKFLQKENLWLHG